MVEENEKNRLKKMKRIGCKSISDELEKLPTISQGQADDLKIDTGTLRIWVSRVDGSVSYEVLRDGKWELVDECELR